MFFVDRKRGVAAPPRCLGSAEAMHQATVEETAVPTSVAGGLSSRTITTQVERALGTNQLGLAEVLRLLAGGGDPPIKITAYDGSSVGPDDAELGVELLPPRATTYLASSLGQLGIARSYISGDLELRGVHPGNSL